VIWWCEGQPSDRGRRPQRRRRPCPRPGAGGRAAGPGRRQVPWGGPSAAGQGVCARAAGGPALQALLDARRARRRPHPRRDGSTCSPGQCGTKTRSATTSATTWSSTRATRGRCWWWTRPATPEKGTTTIWGQAPVHRHRRAGRERPGRRLAGLRQPGWAWRDRPGTVCAQELAHRPRPPAGRRCPRPGAVCHQAGPGQADAGAGVGRGGPSAARPALQRCRPPAGLVGVATPAPGPRPHLPLPPASRRTVTDHGAQRGLVQRRCHLPKSGHDPRQVGQAVARRGLR
jgi:hypothetical protein